MHANSPTLHGQRKTGYSRDQIGGAQGFVSKSQLAGTLFNAVHAILKKETFFEEDGMEPD
jgi:hypothetical protein